jgi:hypothetical protein
MSVIFNPLGADSLFTGLLSCAWAEAPESAEATAVAPPACCRILRRLISRSFIWILLTRSIRSEFRA